MHKQSLKNAESAGLPSYLLANEHMHLFASVNPNTQLSTGKGEDRPGFLRVKDLRQMEQEGRSPVKTSDDMYSPPKRVYKGWRIALSKEFPQLLSHRHDVQGAVIPPEKLHLRTLTPGENVEFKSPAAVANYSTPRTIVKLPKDQSHTIQEALAFTQRAYPSHKPIPDTKYFSGTFTSSVDAQRRLGIEYAL
jgi:hypothetical protein